MRHPVSTPTMSCGEFQRSGMDARIVLGLVLPSAPEDADPCAREDSGSMLMGAASCFSSVIDVSSPWGGMPGIVCETDDGLAEAMIAGPSTNDTTAFSRSMGDRTDAGFRGEMVLGNVTLPIISQFCENLGRTDPTGPREGHDDPAIGKLSDRVFDARRQLGDLKDVLFEQCCEGTHEFSSRIDFAFFSVAHRRVVKPFKELGRGSSPRIMVLSQEAGESLFSEPCRALRRGVSTDESKSYGAVYSGENGDGPRPKVVEQAAQLVGKHDPLGNQIIPTTHQDSQCPDVVRDGTDRTETVSVGTQDVGKHVGVAGIGLSPGCSISRTTGFDGIRVNRHDRMPGFDQSIDEQPGRPFYSDGQFSRWCQLAQRCNKSREASGIMGSFPACHYPTAIIDQTDGVARAAPVQSCKQSHMPTSSHRCKSTRAGRSDGSLTDRRSGRQALALHPVVRCGLPAPAARLVSSGPSNGKHLWSSRQMLGLLNTTPLRGSASNSQEVL